MLRQRYGPGGPSNPTAALRWPVCLSEVAVSNVSMSTGVQSRTPVGAGGRERIPAASRSASSRPLPPAARSIEDIHHRGFEKRNKAQIVGILQDKRMRRSQDCGFERRPSHTDSTSILLRISRDASIEQLTSCLHRSGESQITPWPGRRQSFSSPSASATARHIPWRCFRRE